MKIYVADDSETERVLISAVLDMLVGETDLVKIFDNGLDLWFECLADPPDLVIVDLMLTSLGGLDFLTLLRTHKHWKQEIIVLVVSSVSPEVIKSEVLRALKPTFISPTPRIHWRKRSELFYRAVRFPWSHVESRPGAGLLSKLAGKNIPWKPHPPSPVPRPERLTANT